ncbi:molybdopterin converting factor subunit 1 [archaeon]|nr:MAG: molybdopterin converting factor subunit 1 [archaeon]
METVSVITVQVLFFASIREVLSKSDQRIELKEGSTCEDLQAMLCKQYPSLDFVKNRVSIAVNKVYVPPSTVLKDKDIVAFIPPISGG